MEIGRSFEELLRSTRALLVEANGRDLTELTDGEIVEATELSAEVAKLAEAAHIRAVGRLDVSRAWAADGSRSGAAWVAWHCHVAKGRAGVVLKCARQLRAMPGVDEAMAAGRLSVDHVRPLDPITGEIFLRELERLEQELFEADWADARERLGEAATTADLRRTPKQRRADALRVMAERSAAKPADATEARVLLHVLAGDRSVEQMCELSNGTVITPGQVLPLLQWADVARVIFDGQSRVVDVGVRQRLFTGATRTAVEMRDRFCQHPSCDVPAERCQIDHIIPYDKGGLTAQANGRCYCPFHHRWHHRQHQPAA